MRAGGRLHIGCSGWQYKHWRGEFYPAELPQTRWFAHYALSFDTAEINNTFYRLPDAAAFKKWREQAPQHFLYAVKASRFFTHMKKLKDPDDPLRRFFDNVKHLEPHLGPILYQLPPRRPLNLERFETFLQSIRTVAAEVQLGAPCHVVEFREPSWYDDRVFTLLDRHDIALCLHDMQGSESGTVAIGPLIYVRFHFGTQKYGGAYSDRQIALWGDWLAQQAAAGRDVYAYFNNDAGGQAPRDAIRLRQRIQLALAA